MIDRRREGETAAFPLCMDASQDGPAFKNEGMSLRDYFAGQALAGALSDSGNISKGGITVSAANIANFAYMIADAMIKARGK